MTPSPLLVFDGDCGICTASARWIRTRASRVSVVSHHEYGVASIDKVLFVDESGRREGADAIAAVLRRCDAARWRVAGSVIGAPIIRVVARVVYRVIASNRTRLSRALGLNACEVQPSDRSAVR